VLMKQHINALSCFVYDGVVILYTYQPIYKDKAQLHTRSRLCLMLLILSRERTLRVLRCEEAPIMHSGQCCQARFHVQACGAAHKVA
jgi:hypothetical protein